MDAVAYQMSFNKEQLALLCANYDRRIDSLGAENKKLKAQNRKLRELVKDLHADMWASGEWLEPYEQRMRELGVEP